MNKLSISRSQMFTRRALFFSASKLAVMAALASRLYYLQFVKAEEYKTLAEGNRIKVQLLAPERGRILDRNGLPLAENTRNYRLLIEQGPGAEVQQALDKIATLIETDEAKVKQALSAATRSRYAPPALVKDHLTWDEVSAIEFHLPELPGTVIESGQVRSYPLSDKAAHLIGYVGAVAEDDIEEDQPLLRLPDFKIGKSGVEMMIEPRLRGKAGVKQAEVNVHGLPVRELSTRASIAGESARLTIDRTLQELAATLLQEQKSGAAVAINVRNGDVLALVSMPGFDPNSFSLGIKTNYWKSLLADTKHPLINKAIAGVYPPGSTFKMMVGLAGLDAGVIHSHSTVFCPGYFYLGSHQFNCWKKEGHGTVSVREAIMGSCDTFFYTVAQRLGIDKFADMSRKFGLGSSTDIGLFGEKSGLIPDNAWKRKRYNQPWQGGDTINAGIGQGYVLATPLQLAVMTARIANGGYAVKPRLIAPEHEETAGIAGAPMHIDEAHLGAIQEGMIAVVNSPGGTAFGKRIAEPGLEMAGKTGTSQVKKILQRGMNQNLLPWEDRHHALFVGYAPVAAPRFATAVLVEHGGGGSAVAAPIARELLLKLQLLYPASTASPAQG